MTATNRRSVRPALLRQMNERAIFELLLQRPDASRGALMRALGVTAPTVHKAIASLARAGLVEEVGVDPERRVGRPGMVYRVASKPGRVLGVAVDARQVAVVSAGLDGKIDEKSTVQFATPKTYAALLDSVAGALKPRIKRSSPTIGIGISMPGEIDFVAQRVLLSPNLHVTDGQSLSADLAGQLEVPAVMYHETTGTCLAEWNHGEARGLKDFVMIGVYEGFGTSIVSDGRLLHGRSGIGGELGHVTVERDGEPCGCGNRGCIETVATDHAFARRVSQRLGRPMSIEAIVAASRAGELDVRRELDETFAYLAIGAAAAINLFNPEALLLCSRMFDIDDGALARLTEMTLARALGPLRAGCRIVRAEGDTRRGAVASIIHHIAGTLGPVL